MKKIIYLVLLGAISSSCINADGFFSSHDIPCSIKESMPKIEDGCFTEACDVLRYNKAIRSTKLYSGPDLSSEIVGELKKCDEINYFKVKTKTTTLGRVKFLKDYKNFKKDNEAFLLSFAADGKIEFCHNDQILSLNYHEEKKVLKVTDWPKSEKWIELKVNDQLVYAPYDRSQPFYMGHFDFDPSQKCQDEKSKQ